MTLDEIAGAIQVSAGSALSKKDLLLGLFRLSPEIQDLASEVELLMSRSGTMA